MTYHEINLKDYPKGSQIIFLFLLGLWSASQLISVLGLLPGMVLSILHHFKNILGAMVVVWSLLVILFQLFPRNLIKFDKKIFISPILFSFYVTLINIIRYELSWKEVLLYWFWITGVYLAFPAMLQDEHMRRRRLRCYSGPILWCYLPESP